MQVEPTTSEPSEIERVLTIIRRRFALILVCLVVGAGIAVAISLLQTTEYSASATLLFRNPGFAEDLFGTTANQQAPQNANREAATNEKLVGLRIVSARTANALGDITAQEVAGMVSIGSEGEAELVSVTATSPSPEEAQRVANTFAHQFIVFRASTDKSKLVQAKRLAEKELDRLSGDERDGVRGKSLSRSAEKLGILASLQTGNAEIVQPAELPESPSSPKPLRNGILGGIAGLLLGLVLATVSERLNRRLRDPEEAKEAFSLPVLGTIPESKAIMAANQGVAAPELPFMENEAFRMLRASLQYFNVDRQIRSVLITSYGAGVGKSTIAWNLARVASTSARVVLLETDLRNSTIAQQHGLAMGPGLAEVLTHQVDLDEAIQSKAIAARSNGSEGAAPALDVVVAGSHPPNPAELTESEALREVLSRLKERYDLVVIDTAPIGVVADAFPLMREVDGVIAVCRMGLTMRDHAVHLTEQLRRMDAPSLGIVANGIKVKRGRYGYGYYGGYYGKAAEQATAPSPTPDAERGKAAAKS